MLGECGPGGLGVGRGPEVVGDRQGLALDVAGRVAAKAWIRAAHVCGLRVELQAVLPRIDQLRDAHQLACHGARPARHTGDERVAGGEPAELGARRLGHARRVGAVDDRRQHAVDVEKQRRPSRLCDQLGECIHRP